MNLPNKLTVLRVVLIPFFVFFFMMPMIPGNNYIAVGIYAVACLTDWFDGKIARKYNLVTNFGKFMDPLADKILVITAMILFVADAGYEGARAMSPIALIIIVAREFIISGFRLIAAEKGTVIAAGWWGKVKTAVTMVMTIVVIIHIDTAWYWWTEQVLIWVSVALTVISLVEYLAKNAKNVLSDK